GLSDGAQRDRPHPVPVPLHQQRERVRVTGHMVGQQRGVVTRVRGRPIDGPALDRSTSEGFRIGGARPAARRVGRHPYASISLTPARNWPPFGPSLVNTTITYRVVTGSSSSTVQSVGAASWRATARQSSRLPLGGLSRDPGSAFGTRISTSEPASDSSSSSRDNC